MATIASPTPVHPDAATETTAPYFQASPLSQIHPGHARELACFLSLEAGWTTADLDLLDGDRVFNAEVALVMATLEASRPG